MSFDRITIIGLGLIGSSIARAAREKRLAETIVGCDSNQLSLTTARAQHIIDIALADAKTAVQGSQLVILATPPGTLGTVTQTIAPALAQGSIVMDVASVKRAAMDAIAPHLPAGVEFIPAHPIAGSEQSGIAAGRADLFAGKRVIITPFEPKHTPALTSVTRFWSGMGAHVEAMPADLHDVIYGHVSHLPQLLAFAAKGTLADYTDDAALTKFLRISHSNPALWADIFAQNKTNLLAALDRYLDAIIHVKRELAQAPADAPQDADEKLAYTKLFPRIAASCLITTVMEAEKKIGVPFARYAGTGFADFTSPATSEPEGDLERISNHHIVVRNALEDYVQRLSELTKQLQ